MTKKLARPEHSTYTNIILGQSILGIRYKYPIIPIIKREYWKE